MKQQYQINYSALTIPTTSNAKSPLEQKKKALVLSAFVRWRGLCNVNRIIIYRINLTYRLCECLQIRQIQPKQI